MNSDFRLNTGFFTHPKTVKLLRRVGAEGGWCFLRLLAFTAQNRSKGLLHGLDTEDIEIAAGWTGKPDELVAALIEVGFLEESQQGLRVHDWAKHNPYAFHSEERSRSGKRSVMFRWVTEELRRTGREEEIDSFRAWVLSREYKGEPWEQLLAEYDAYTGRIRPNAEGNTPPPAPSPAPLPSPVKGKQNSSPSGEARKHASGYRTKRKRILSGYQLEWFEQFWETFDYKSGKAEAADAWLDLEVTENILPELLEGAKREAMARPALRKSGRIPKMAQGWLSGRRWEDEGEQQQYAQREPLRFQEADY